MRNNYLKSMFVVALMSAATTMGAVDFPTTYPTQELTDGGKYILCNLANPTGYMARTSWDGAYYFLGETDSKYQEREITAHFDAENNRWYFTTGETYHEAVPADEENGIEAQEAYTSYTYFGVPSGTDNVNGNLTEEAYWTVTPGITSGFYYLTAGDGQGNSMVIGLSMHLNSNGQYWVISEPTNGWYPDFYGGVVYEEDGETPVTVYDEATDSYSKVMADSTSMNWAFVKVEDVPAYVLTGNAWNSLNSFEKNYCSIEGYEDGFKATLSAAEVIFSTIPFTDAEYTAMKDMLQAKNDLYTQILRGEEKGESSLAKAIETAKEAFNTLSATDDVNAATATLKKVLDDFDMGLGDITSMGQNMSFEDLSAQNGATTVGKAPAPTGWTVYVNGTAQAAGSTDLISSFNWHGVNDDCDTYKDGNYGFGVWAATIPEYEISQTISGLDNGTYTITAGLMVANDRRTTQRLFGNYNSTLFGSEDGYVEGFLPMEYKTYAGLTETASERAMQELSVKAYVYDGTLTFGIRTNGDYTMAQRTYGNGGDGWFKCDNFTITKDGFNADDQKNLYNYFSDNLTDIANQPMDANYKEKYQNVESDDMDKAIPELAGLITEAQAQADAYVPLRNKLDEAMIRLEAVEEAGYKGVDAYSDVYDDIEGLYADGAYTAEQIQTAVDSLEAAYQTCLRSGVEEGADVSDLIINRSFEDLSNQGNANSNGVVNAPKGWNLYLNGVKCETAEEINAQGVNGWCAINSGDNIDVTDEYGTQHTHQYTDGTHLWGIWNASIPSVELSQEITGLEPGTYTLTADVMARCTDWTGDNLTTQRIFAQNVICLYGTESDYIPEYLQGTTSDDIYQAYNLAINEGKMLDDYEEYEYINYGGYDAYSNDLLLRTLVLHFGVGEDGKATIGFRTDALDGWTGEAQTNTASGWFKVDNFTLYYESSQVPTNIEKTTVSAVSGKGAIYNLAGQRVARATKGVYIQDGRKVLR